MSLRKQDFLGVVFVVRNDGKAFDAQAKTS